MKVIKSEYLLVRDSNNNIVFPSNVEKLGSILDMLNNSNNDIIHDEVNEEWYECKNESIIIDRKKYRITFLSNITEYIKKINEYIKRVGELQKDETTNANTKKSTFELFRNYLNSIYSNPEDFAVIICDIDEFKKINDKYGHIFGDKVLKKVADTLYCNVSKNSIIGRIGGDEFLIILKNTSEVEAYEIIEKVRNIIEKTYLVIDGKKVKMCTMSFGINHISRNRVHSSSKKEISDEILYCSDVAMYLSKKSGKNKVTLYNEK